MTCLSIDECLTFLQGGQARRDNAAVHRHLDECDDCRILIAEAVRSVVEPNVAAPRTVLRVLADGERVGDRYQIQRFVARGGMGEVYEALDTALGERVALKTLAITAADQLEAVEGLLREVRTARRVIHPNVCRILELGIHKRGTLTAESIPFLTMDFLQGETLRQRITREGPLSPDKVRQITHGLAAGLEAVHAAGIVHRDFKSENVLLVRSADGSERPVIMDFGLARGFEGSSVGASAGRRMAGTASYMAPEQLTGQPATAATDVFALGIVLFEMLTSKLPFSGDSLAAVALSRLQQTPPLVSSLVPGIDRVWDAVITRCLDRVPQKRFARMTDLLAVLDPVGPVTPARKRGAWAWAAGVVALAAIVGTAMFTSRPRQTDPPPPPAPTLSADQVAPAQPASAPPPSPAAVPAPAETVAAQPAPSKIAVAAHPTHRQPIRTLSAPRPSAAAAPKGERVAEEDPLAPAPPRPRHPDDLANPF